MHRQIKGALVFLNVPSAAPLLAKIAYPDMDNLKRFVSERAELGYPQVVLPGPVLSSLEDSSPPDKSSGLVASLSQDSSGFTLSGWAYLPKAQCSAELILITLPNPQNQDAIVGMSPPIDGDAQQAKILHCPESTLLTWSIILPRDSKLEGLKAWSFDGQECRAYPLPVAPGIDSQLQKMAP